MTGGISIVVDIIMSILVLVILLTLSSSNISFSIVGGSLVSELVVVVLGSLFITHSVPPSTPSRIAVEVSVRVSSSIISKSSSVSFSFQGG